MSTARPMQRRRRFNRAQLEHQLKILKNVVGAPLLPPSLDELPPPPSRSASPAPSVNGWRKHQLDDGETSVNKVSRTSLSHTSASDTRSAPVPRVEEPPVASTSASTAQSLSAPTAAPIATAPTPGGPDPAPFVYRRGRPTSGDFFAFHEKFLNEGRLLKKSSEKRTQMALNASAQGKISTSNHLATIARFEAFDALLNFAYGMWSRDMADGKVHYSMWETMDQFLKWVRKCWETPETKGPVMSAFIGLIRLLEAHIFSRQSWYLNNLNAGRLSKLDEAFKAAAKPEPASSISPATSLGGSSSHSTAHNGSPGAPSPLPSGTATSRPPPPPNATPSTSKSNTSPISISKESFDNLNSALQTMSRATRAMPQSQMYLNLPILSKHFPQTFVRVSSVQLRYDEEYEVDFEQDSCARNDGSSGLSGGDPAPNPGEGQLWMPSGLTAASGEGIAWVCLLGRALLREAAYPLGYRGIDGAFGKETMALR